MEVSGWSDQAVHSSPIASVWEAADGSWWKSNCSKARFGGNARLLTEGTVEDFAGLRHSGAGSLVSFHVPDDTRTIPNLNETNMYVLAEGKLTFPR